MWLTKTANKKVLCALAVILMTALAPVAPAGAVCANGQQSCSGSYGVSESFFGNGGELNACSSNYCSKQSSGELGVGQTCGTAYCAQAGFNTDRSESLEFVVNSGNIDMGVLTSSSTHVGTATFHVKSYLTDGYQVVNASPPPKNGSYTMNALTSPTASSVGTEQFGINVVANSCPGTAPSSGPGSCSGSLGANPVQVPGNTFSFGSAATGYNTANQYKYVMGDTVASTTKSSGETDYTMSYIMNVSGVTPGGTYTMNHVLVATSTF